jgi:hypothetical protein
MGGCALLCLPTTTLFPRLLSTSAPLHLFIDDCAAVLAWGGIGFGSGRMRPKRSARVAAANGRSSAKLPAAFRANFVCYAVFSSLVAAFDSKAV